MSKFNKEKRIRNNAGGMAFAIKDPKEELFNIALTTFFKDQFYETGDERLERIKQCIAMILKRDPAGALWICKLCGVLRDWLHMRSVVHVIIGELALSRKGGSLVSSIILQTAHRPDDLTEIAAYVGMPMPKQVKRGIRRALQRFDPYQLGKYKMGGKGISLVDLFNITHPNPYYVDEATKRAWKDLMEGKLKNEGTWESMLSNSKDDEERRLALCDLIAEGNMGYMALLRNLNNLIKYNVPPRILSIALEKITDREEIKKSRQLPFRFYNAFKNVKGNIKITNAISEAMDISCEIGDAPSGNILIAIDSSGSMHHGEREDTTHFMKAAVLAAINIKKKDDDSSGNVDVILYSDKVSLPVISTNTPVTSIVQSLESQKISGRTDTSLVFDYAGKNWNDYSSIIILSDNESWGGNVQAAHDRMVNTVGATPKIFAIDIAGNGTFDVAGNNVTRISGWSDRIFDFIYAKNNKSLYLAAINTYYLMNFMGYPQP